LGLEKIDRSRSLPSEREPFESHRISEHSGRSLKCRSKKINSWFYYDESCL